MRIWNIRFEVREQLVLLTVDARQALSEIVAEIQRAVAEYNYSYHTHAMWLPGLGHGLAENGKAKA